MTLLDAFSAESDLVLGAVEVISSHVLLAEVLRQALLVLVFKIEITLGQHIIFLHDFEEDVNVQWESLCTLQRLYELPADRAPHSVLVMEL